MDNSFDREKVIDCMFDPITSEIIAELEDGQKDSKYLEEKSSLSETEIRERLSYLIDHGFITESKKDQKTIFSANVQKFSLLMEDGENFGAAIEGLEKMDSFLN
ncbi:MAG: hypothetical protein GTN35_01455 [Nitrososphaeria archaeon]|nr:hypothetical protein [Nitrosopumilaceae archaeon]NIP10095.1 hypothetical protein [Nitrosopumilaceae archaeon]NIP91072.1 hypothetical protein [Nitrososphaeria archaeon]NIS94891.1 hypothetical protein [Nitrosopumilaceae archaeon]